MKTIRILSPAVAAVVATPFLAAPFVGRDFDVHDAPEAPPLSAITIVSTASDVHVAYNTISDEPVDVRPIRLLTLSGERSRRWRLIG